MSKDYSKYSTFLTFFSLIGFSTILKRAGIYKKDGPEKRGLGSVEMFKELLISIMVGKSVNTYSKSGKALNSKNGISKSSMYRFMSSESFSWRTFLCNLAFTIVSKINR